MGTTEDTEDTETAGLAAWRRSSIGMWAGARAA
jgi:hypothetical protein